MRNIEPWCVSRQLWWGHRIPAWYGPDGEIFVAHSEDDASELARSHYRKMYHEEKVPAEIKEIVVAAQEGGPIALSRDPDVLDTWFSSALWPFSTLGWPEETPELEKHYPNTVLVTAFDIIFFWVARMMMMGLYTHKEIPFPEVYIHGLVVDEKGQKMSKSKGNGIDPLVLIDKYGADAIRFSLCAQAAQGRNVRISDARVEGYRNFSTKLWNAARFTQMNECAVDPSFDPATATGTLNQWIIHEANACAVDVTKELETYRFNDAANAIYRFIWNVYCDWYLELSKPILQGDDADLIEETRKTTAWALDQILKLLHPFMPFVTEELWGRAERSGINP